MVNEQRITVILWRRRGSHLNKGKLTGHYIGHATHRAQMTVYGSKDLADQITDLLNKATPITYTMDEED